MGLWERLCRTEQPHLPVHQFMSALGEIERGKMTEQQLLDALVDLPATAPGGPREATQTEINELAALVLRIRTPLEAYPLCGRVILTNVGAAYDANIDSQSLPFIYLQKAGVTRVDIELRVRKVGSGSQDWQLWNDTDASPVVGPGDLTTGSLTDSAAAGDHTLNASRTFGAPLPPGVVKLRLRARSGTAADDPVFLNAALLIFRVDKMTSVELHEVLCLAEKKIAPLDTVALVKTRLGIS